MANIQSYNVLHEILPLGVATERSNREDSALQLKKQRGEKALHGVRLRNICSVLQHT